tara:strand:+ start:38515 stop:47982 length:9468 start_codon:yes stop_codon:yes gene_type:complete
MARNWTKRDSFVPFIEKGKVSISFEEWDNYRVKAHENSIPAPSAEYDSEEYTGQLPEVTNFSVVVKITRRGNDLVAGGHGYQLATPSVDYGAWAFSEETKNFARFVGSDIMVQWWGKTSRFTPGGALFLDPAESDLMGGDFLPRLLSQNLNFGAITATNDPENAIWNDLNTSPLGALADSLTILYGPSNAVMYVPNTLREGYAATAPLAGTAHDVSNRAIIQSGPIIDPNSLAEEVKFLVTMRLEDMEHIWGSAGGLLESDEFDEYAHQANLLQPWSPPVSTLTFSKFVEASLPTNVSSENAKHFSSEQLQQNRDAVIDESPSMEGMEGLTVGTAAAPFKMFVPTPYGETIVFDSFNELQTRINALVNILNEYQKDYKKSKFFYVGPNTYPSNAGHTNPFYSSPISFTDTDIFDFEQESEALSDFADAMFEVLKLDDRDLLDTSALQKKSIVIGFDGYREAKFEANPDSIPATGGNLLEVPYIDYIATHVTGREGMDPAWDLDLSPIRRGLYGPGGYLGRSFGPAEYGHLNYNVGNYGNKGLAGTYKPRYPFNRPRTLNFIMKLKDITNYVVSATGVSLAELADYCNLSAAEKAKEGLSLEDFVQRNVSPPPKKSFIQLDDDPTIAEILLAAEKWENYGKTVKSKFEALAEFDFFGEDIVNEVMDNRNKNLQEYVGDLVYNNLPAKPDKIRDLYDLYAYVLNQVDLQSIIAEAILCLDFNYSLEELIDAMCEKMIKSLDKGGKLTAFIEFLDTGTFGPVGEFTGVDMQMITRELRVYVSEKERESGLTTGSSSLDAFLSRTDSTTKRFICEAIAFGPFAGLAALYNWLMDQKDKADALKDRKAFGSEKIPKRKKCEVSFTFPDEIPVLNSIWEYAKAQILIRTEEYVMEKIDTYIIEKTTEALWAIRDYCSDDDQGADEEPQFNIADFPTDNQEQINTLLEGEGNFLEELYASLTKKEICILLTEDIKDGSSLTDSVIEKVVEFSQERISEFPNMATKLSEKTKVISFFGQISSLVNTRACQEERLPMPPIDDLCDIGDLTAQEERMIRRLRVKGFSDEAIVDQLVIRRQERRKTLDSLLDVAVDGNPASFADNPAKDAIIAALEPSTRNLLTSVYGSTTNTFAKDLTDYKNIALDPEFLNTMKFQNENISNQRLFGETIQGQKSFYHNYKLTVDLNEPPPVARSACVEYDRHMSLMRKLINALKLDVKEHFFRSHPEETATTSEKIFYWNTFFENLYENDWIYGLYEFMHFPCYQGMFAGPGFIGRPHTFKKEITYHNYIKAIDGLTLEENNDLIRIAYRYYARWKDYQVVEGHYFEEKSKDGWGVGGRGFELKPFANHYDSFKTDPLNKSQGEILADIYNTNFGGGGGNEYKGIGISRSRRYNIDGKPINSTFPNYKMPSTGLSNVFEKGTIKEFLGIDSGYSHTPAHQAIPWYAVNMGAQVNAAPYDPTGAPNADEQPNLDGHIGTFPALCERLHSNPFQLWPNVNMDLEWGRRRGRPPRNWRALQSNPKEAIKELLLWNWSAGVNQRYAYEVALDETLNYSPENSKIRPPSYLIFNVYGFHLPMALWFYKYGNRDLHGYSRWGSQEKLDKITIESRNTDPPGKISYKVDFDAWTLDGQVTQHQIGGVTHLDPDTGLPIIWQIAEHPIPKNILGCPDNSQPTEPESPVELFNLEYHMLPPFNRDIGTKTAGKSGCLNDTYNFKFYSVYEGADNYLIDFVSNKPIELSLSSEEADPGLSEESKKDENQRALRVAKAKKALAKQPYFLEPVKMTGYLKGRPLAPQTFQKLLMNSIKSYKFFERYHPPGASGTKDVDGIVYKTLKERIDRGGHNAGLFGIYGSIYRNIFRRLSKMIGDSLNNYVKIIDSELDAKSILNMRYTEGKALEQWKKLSYEAPDDEEFPEPISTTVMMPRPTAVEALVKIYIIEAAFKMAFVCGTFNISNIFGDSLGKSFFSTVLFETEKSIEKILGPSQISMPVLETLIKQVSEEISPIIEDEFGTIFSSGNTGELISSILGSRVYNLARQSRSCLRYADHSILPGQPDKNGNVTDTYTPEGPQSTNYALTMEDSLYSQELKVPDHYARTHAKSRFIVKEELDPLNTGQVDLDVETFGATKGKAETAMAKKVWNYENHFYTEPRFYDFKDAGKQKVDGLVLEKYIRIKLPDNKYEYSRPDLKGASLSKIKFTKLGWKIYDYYLEEFNQITQKQLEDISKIQLKIKKAGLMEYCGYTDIATDVGGKKKGAYVNPDGFSVFWRKLLGAPVASEEEFKSTKPGDKKVSPPPFNNPSTFNWAQSTNPEVFKKHLVEIARQGPEGKRAAEVMRHIALMEQMSTLLFCHGTHESRFARFTKNKFTTVKEAEKNHAHPKRQRGIWWETIYDSQTHTPYSSQITNPNANQNTSKGIHHAPGIYNSSVDNIKYETERYEEEARMRIKELERRTLRDFIIPPWKKKIGHGKVTVSSWDPEIASKTEDFIVPDDATWEHYRYFDLQQGPAADWWEKGPVNRNSKYNYYSLHNKIGNEFSLKKQQDRSRMFLAAKDPLYEEFADEWTLSKDLQRIAFRYYTRYTYEGGPHTRTLQTIGRHQYEQYMIESSKLLLQGYGSFYEDPAAFTLAEWDNHMLRDENGILVDFNNPVVAEVLSPTSTAGFGNFHFPRRTNNHEQAGSDFRIDIRSMLNMSGYSLGTSHFAPEGEITALVHRKQDIVGHIPWSADDFPDIGDFAINYSNQETPIHVKGNDGGDMVDRDKPARIHMSYLGTLLDSWDIVQSVPYAGEYTIATQNEVQEEWPDQGGSVWKDTDTIAVFYGTDLARALHYYKYGLNKFREMPLPGSDFSEMQNPDGFLAQLSPYSVFVKPEYQLPFMPEEPGLGTYRDIPMEKIADELKYGIRLSYVLPNSVHEKSLREDIKNAVGREPVYDFTYGANLRVQEGDAQQLSQVEVLKQIKSFYMKEVPEDFSESMVFSEEGLEDAVENNEVFMLPLLEQEIDAEGSIEDISFSDGEAGTEQKVKQLYSAMRDNDEFKLLFEYMFPVKRMLAMIGLYNMANFDKEIGVDYLEDPFLESKHSLRENLYNALDLPVPDPSASKISVFSRNVTLDWAKISGGFHGESEMGADELGSEQPAPGGAGGGTTGDGGTTGGGTTGGGGTGGGGMSGGGSY